MKKKEKNKWNRKRYNSPFSYGGFRLKNVSSVNDIKSQIRGFVSKGIITEKQASIVNPYKIYKFLPLT